MTAVLVLALGIGVNTAVFTFVNALLLKPMAGRSGPGEVVGLYSRDREHPDRFRDFSYPNYLDIRDRNQLFGDVTAFTLNLAGVRDGDVTRRTLVATIVSNYFRTLGVSLQAGRTFTPDEERPGSAAAVAIVSDDYWRTRGKDQAAVGSTVTINARPFTIVGIAPKGFGGTTAVITPEVWVPTGAWEIVANDSVRQDGALPLSDRRNEALMVVGRLRPGLSQAGAAPALARLSLEMERGFPSENKGQELMVATLPRLTLSSAPQDDTGSLGYSAIVLAMAGVVLLIASINLANMFLARGSARRKEMAMRAALGGSRARLVRQLLTEGAVLSLAGGAGALLVSYWAGRIVWTSLLARSPLPMRFDPSPDAAVILATLAFAALSTLVFGLGPALKLSRGDLVSQLKEGGIGGGGGRRRGRWSGPNLLVAAQLALSLGLLTTAGLFTRGALNATHAEPGYRLDRRVLASVDPSLAGYDEARGRTVHRELSERLRALPGVASASPSSLVAFGMLSESRAVRAVGGAGAGASAAATPVFAAIGADYFRTLGLSLLRGRDFTTAEEKEGSGPRTAIIDVGLARALFGEQDPVGRSIALDDGNAGARTPLLVVGLAPGLRQSLWDKAPVPHLYVPTGQVYRSALSYHVQLAEGASQARVLDEVRKTIRAVDDRLPVLALQTLAEHRDGTSAYWAVRTMAAIFSVFGGLALFLAIVGVYGVNAYLVAGRTRELGIRIALGSTPARAVWLVIGDGVRLAGTALVVGLAFALGSGRLVANVLYQVSPFDALVFTAAPALLALSALAACYLPARRATRIAPVVALRTE